MQVKFEVTPIFPQTIVRTKIELSAVQNEDLLNSFYSEEFQNVNDEISSMSVSKDKNILNKFTYLKEKLNEVFRLSIKSIYKIENDFVMTTSWLTKSEKNQSSDFHVHTNSVFSGVYYPNFNKENPSIHFQKTFLPEINLNFSEFNNYNVDLCTFNPSRNDVIFFPSRLNHKVATNYSNQTRYSIAFNFFPTGKIGVHDSFMNVNVNEQ